MPEVIPELALIVGLFFAIVGYITARGLLATWTHSLGYVFAWLGKHARIPIPLGISTPHVDLGGPFRAVDGWVVAALQNWCDGAEIQMGYCLHGMRKVALYTAQAIDFLARETTETFDWMRHVSLPKWAKWAAIAAVPPALLARLIAHAVASLVPHTVRLVRTEVHTVTHTVTSTIARAATATIPGLHDLPWIRREVFGWTKRWARINSRLHRLELLFGATAAAALVARALGLSVRCVRPGGNLGRLARSVCGAPSWLIRFLVAGAIEGFIVSDLCEFSDLILSQTESLRPALLQLVDVENALVGCHDFDAPRTFALPPVSLPALVDPVSLAA